VSTKKDNKNSYLAVNPGFHEKGKEGLSLFDETVNCNILEILVVKRVGFSGVEKSQG